MLFSNLELQLVTSNGKTIACLRFLYVFKTKLKIKKILNDIKDYPLKKDFELLKNMLESRKIGFDFMKKTKVLRSNITYYESMYDLNIYNTFVANEIFLLYHSFLKKHFLEVKNEHYLIRVSKKRMIEFDINIGINLFNALWICTRNINEIIDLKKKRNEKYEWSWTIFKIKFR